MGSKNVILLALPCLQFIGEGNIFRGEGVNLLVMLPCGFKPAPAEAKNVWENSDVVKCVLDSKSYQNLHVEMRFRNFFK